MVTRVIITGAEVVIAVVVTRIIVTGAGVTIAAVVTRVIVTGAGVAIAAVVTGVTTTRAGGAVVVALAVVELEMAVVTGAEVAMLVAEDNMLMASPSAALAVVIG